MNNIGYSRLINEESPFLLSHACQDIDWHMWGNDVFEKAQREGKLLFISIGYSASYWCNWMSHICFNDKLIVEELNKHYISVIVDKDERPDINMFYLNAIQIISETSGWPITCFALPDGVPIYGGTYFQPQQFYERIVNLYISYCENRKQFVSIGNDLMDILKKQTTIQKNDIRSNFSIKDLRLIIEPWKRKFDREFGGNQSMPKFPLANSIWFLIYSYFYTRDINLLEHVDTTIKGIMNGAIFDHLNGGFFRYAIDKRWRIPKFEKILLDNSQLIILLLPLYRFVTDISSEKILHETLSFIEREFRSKEGLYYCGLMSNISDEEGGFYLWTATEVRSIFSKEIEAEIALDYFGIEEEGPINGKSVPFLSLNISGLAQKYNLSISDAEKIIEKIKSKMRTHRQKNKPLPDKKIITSWNASIAWTFASIYTAWDDEVYLKKAQHIADYIIENRMDANGCLYRVKFQDKEIEGFLADYAYTINLLLLIHDLTLKDKYLDIVIRLTQYAIDHFLDPVSGMFFFSSDRHDSPMRLFDLIDTTYPSSNSMISLMLTLLTYSTGNPYYWILANQMLNNIKPEMSGSGPFVAHWGRVLLLHTFVPVVPYTDDEHVERLNKIIRKWQRPNVIVGNVVSKLKTKESRYSPTSRCYYYYIDPTKGDAAIEEFKDYVIRNKMNKIQD